VALNWQNWDAGMMLNEGMFAGSKGYVLKPEGYRATKLTDVEKSPRDIIVPAIPAETLDLKIEVLAAQNLTKNRKDINISSLHPFVRVDLHVEDRAALPAADRDCQLETARVIPVSSASSSSSNITSLATGKDALAARYKEKQIKEQEKEGQYKLRTKTSRGSDPDFGGEELRFSVVPGVVPELVFVRFIVRAEEMMQRDALVGWACVRLDRLRQGYRFVHLLDDKGRETEAVLLVKITKTLR